MPFNLWLIIFLGANVFAVDFVDFDDEESSTDFNDFDDDDDANDNTME